MTPTITAFKWVPPFARGFVRDIRARWAFEEAGQAYDVDLVDGIYVKSQAHRYFQPFGQIPTYRDDTIEIFESGAIVLHICEAADALVPADPAARVRATQWLIAALNSVEPWVMQLAVVDVFEADRDWSRSRRPKVMEDLHARLRDLADALGDREALDGGAFTYGDLMMVSVLGGLRGTGVLDDHPNLAAYVARGEARPAHVKAMADHLATFEDAKQGEVA
ncbi:glutathione S-transferase family protein [Sphingomonas sp. CGMCC 1.13654]|uniref:Glutathione S-transferase family protein n=1 Tax=Sphingomonas chungangi TaxID=2683589 RepID=A0A838L113_9SPHN|nr:glutathione S-transferase family protein [Sphingomonas chungangi]MBA2932630.1 glutathione S-transferase family protein [Sphingomonas chungangi]MVW56253.1 glutathione S-transferase family protein [Sphingomonas chungangi]